MFLKRIFVVILSVLVLSPMVSAGSIAQRTADLQAAQKRDAATQHSAAPQGVVKKGNTGQLVQQFGGQVQRQKTRTPALHQKGGTVSQRIKQFEQGVSAPVTSTRQTAQSLGIKPGTVADRRKALEQRIAAPSTPSAPARRTAQSLGIQPGTVAARRKALEQRIAAPSAPVTSTRQTAQSLGIQPGTVAARRKALEQRIATPSTPSAPARQTAQSLGIKPGTVADGRKALEQRMATPSAPVTSTRQTAQSLGINPGTVADGRKALEQRMAAPSSPVTSTRQTAQSLGISKGIVERRKRELTQKMGASSAPQRSVPQTAKSLGIKKGNTARVRGNFGAAASFAEGRSVDPANTAEAKAIRAARAKARAEEEARDDDYSEGMANLFGTEEDDDGEEEETKDPSTAIDPSQTAEAKAIRAARAKARAEEEARDGDYSEDMAALFGTEDDDGEDDGDKKQEDVDDSGEAFDPSQTAEAKAIRAARAKARAEEEAKDDDMSGGMANLFGDDDDDDFEPVKEEEPFTGTDPDAVIAWMAAGKPLPYKVIKEIGFTIGESSHADEWDHTLPKVIIEIEHDNFFPLSLMMEFSGLLAKPIRAAQQYFRVWFAGLMGKKRIESFEVNPNANGQTDFTAKRIKIRVGREQREVTIVSVTLSYRVATQYGLVDQLAKEGYNTSGNWDKLVISFVVDDEGELVEYAPGEDGRVVSLLTAKKDPPNNLAQLKKYSRDSKKKVRGAKRATSSRSASPAKRMRGGTTKPRKLIFKGDKEKIQRIVGAVESFDANAPENPVLKQLGVGVERARIITLTGEDYKGVSPKIWTAKEIERLLASPISKAWREILNVFVSAGIAKNKVDGLLRKSGVVVIANGDETKGFYTALGIPVNVQTKKILGDIPQFERTRRDKMAYIIFIENRGGNMEGPLIIQTSKKLPEGVEDLRRYAN